MYVYIHILGKGDSDDLREKALIECKTQGYILESLEEFNQDGETPLIRY
jgi:hypothetical protein